MIPSLSDLRTSAVNRRVCPGCDSPTASSNEVKVVNPSTYDDIKAAGR